MSKVEDLKHDGMNKNYLDNAMDLDKELSDLSVDLVCLCQELVNAKLKLETTTKSGWLHIAKARYIMGPTSVGRLQLPTSESEKIVLAEKKVNKEECQRGGNKVRYYQHTLVSGNEIPSEVNAESTLKQRKSAKVDAEVGKREDGKGNKKSPNDPIKWFGFLVPSSLRQSQGNFKIATEIAIECANIQSEMLGVENRIKYIQRLKIKDAKKITGLHKNDLEEDVATTKATMKPAEKVAPLMQKLSRSGYFNRIKLKNKFDYSAIRNIMVQFSLLHTIRNRIPKLTTFVRDMYTKLSDQPVRTNIKRLLVPSIQTSINNHKLYVTKVMNDTNNNIKRLFWNVKFSEQFQLIQNRILEYGKRKLGFVKYLEPKATQIVKHLEPKLNYLSVYCQNRLNKVEFDKYLKKCMPTVRVSLESRITKMSDIDLLNLKRALRIHLASQTKLYPLESDTKKTFIIGKSSDEIVKMNVDEEATKSVNSDEKKPNDSKVTFIGVDIGETVSSIGSTVGSKVSSMGSTVGSSVTSMGTSVGSSVSSLRDSVSTGLRNINFPSSLYDRSFNKSSPSLYDRSFSKSSPKEPEDNFALPASVPKFPDIKLKLKPSQTKPKLKPSQLWTKPMYNKSTVDELTKHWVGSLQPSASSPGQHELVQQLEMFCKHLDSFPWAKILAVREQAVGHLLSIQKRDLSDEVNILCRESLSRLGYPRPLAGPGIRVLSIDGGGMRGLIALEMLSKLEELTGKKVYQMFDLICGVSTGSILASLLGLHKMSTGEVINIYLTIGHEVFRQGVLHGTKGFLLKHAYYDANVYEAFLKEFAGEMVLFDTCRSQNTPAVALVSTIVTDVRVEPFVFRNYAFPTRVQPSFKGSSSYKIWEGVRASSSAPGYFHDFSLDGDVHQDGGVMANNPTQIAIREAQCLWPTENLQCVVSLGLGRYQPMTWGRTKTSTSQLSLAQKFSRFVDSATDTELMHEALQGLLPHGVYYRFNPHLSEHMNLDETRPDKMDKMREDSKMYIRRNGEKLEAASKSLVKPAGVRQRVVRAARDLKAKGIASVTPHPAIRYFL